MENIDPYIIHITDNYGIKWYGLLIAIAFILGLFIAGRALKRKNIPTDYAIDITLVAAICGVIGARLYYVAFQWSEFSSNWVSIFKIWEGGLAIYGGILFGLIGVLVYCKIRKLKFLILADAIAPALVLGQAIGRWGNFFNHEAFGYPVTEPSMQWFPFAVKIPYDARPLQYLNSDWFHATFFYESLACFVIFVFLMLYKNRTKFTGEIFGWYVFLYGIERAFVEGMRTDSLYLPGGVLRVSQLLSILFALGALVYLVMNYIKSRHTKSDDVLPETDTDEAENEE